MAFSFRGGGAAGGVGRDKIRSFPLGRGSHETVTAIKGQLYIIPSIAQMQIQNIPERSLNGSGGPGAE